MSTKTFTIAALLALFTVAAHAADCKPNQPCQLAPGANTDAAKKIKLAEAPTAPPAIANSVTCYRLEVESGNAPAECLGFRRTLQSIPYVYIVVPNQARQLEMQRAKVLP